MYFMIAVHTVAVNASLKKLMRFLYSQQKRAIPDHMTESHSSIAIAFGCGYALKRESINNWSNIP